MNNTRSTIALFIALLAAVGAASRLVEHMPNFAPITALAVISGYYLRGRWSWLVPMLAMLLSDAIIGFYSLPVMVSVYGCYLAAWALARNASALTSLAWRTLTSSILFFVVTNAAVWAYSGMYSKTFAGLLQSYIMAIPFFRASFASDMIYTAVFVAIVQAVLSYQSKSLTTSEYAKA